jgi:hypothetical protein
MAFTKKTKARLVSALTRKNLADEFEAKAASPGACSAKLKAAIIAMMANKKAGLEVISALETAGNQTLSGPAHPNTLRRLVNALTRRDAAAEIDSQL